MDAVQEHIELLRNEAKIDTVIDGLRGQGGHSFKAMIESLGPDWPERTIAECEQFELSEGASDEARDTAERLHVKTAEARKLLTATVG